MGKPSPHEALGIDGGPPAPAPELPPLELENASAGRGAP
jgi:hypothetical protein